MNSSKTNSRIGVPRALLTAMIPVMLAIDTRAFQSAEATRDYRYLMGTSVEVEAFGRTPEVRHEAIDAAFGAMAEVDRLMSNYREDSELTHINRAAARQAVEISDPMRSVLEAAQAISVQSDGAFDVTVGPLVRLWGFHDKKPHEPTAAELAAVRSVVGYRNLVLDKGQRSVRFMRSGVEIDLSGIAKGFAVELAANVLRRYGLNGFVDAGGNQYMLGVPPGKRAWSVGVKNPDKPGTLLGVVDCTEGSVSTSANDANFLTINGRTYGHILDPRTLQPSIAALSVTILSPDGTIADAMSKAAFVLGPAKGLALIDSMPRVSGLIAYRQVNGRIGMVMSQQLAVRFHPPPP